MEGTFAQGCCSVAKSCWTLGDPSDYSPPGSSVHGISQAEHWRGLLFPSPGDLPGHGIKPGSPALQVGSWPLNHQGSQGG